jgi:hypothetical protein
MTRNPIGLTTAAAASAVSLALLLAGCGSTSSTSSAGTATSASRTATSTSSARLLADPASAQYEAAIATDAVALTTAMNGYGYPCEADSPPLAKCRASAVDTQAAAQKVLADLGPVVVPPRLSAADAHLRDVLNQIIAAAKTAITTIDSNRQGRLPADLLGLQQDWRNAVGDVHTAAAGH